MSQYSQSPTKNTAHELAIQPSISALAQGSMFWQPEYRQTSPWLEHLPFLFWLVEALKPTSSVGIEVDLVSHFAVCQAVSRLRLGGNSYVIGEANVGQVHDLTEQTVDKYAGISQWLKASPLQAVQQFNEHSIDLLLLNIAPQDESIDDLIDRWVPRLSSKGVILMPGIARREPGCQTFRAFEVLAARYPHLAFYHGAGLGLLAVGDDLPPLVHDLLGALESASAAREVQDVFGRLGCSCLDKVTIQEQQALIHQFETRLKDKADELTTAQNLAETLNQQQAQFAHEHEARITSLTEQLLGKKQALAEKQHQVVQLTDRLQAQKYSLEARFNELAELTRKQQGCERDLSEAQHALQRLNDQLNTNQRQYEQELQTLNDQLKANELQREQLARELKTAEQAAAENFDIQAQQTVEIERQNRELAQLVNLLEAGRLPSEASSQQGTLADNSVAAKGAKLSRWAINRQVKLIRKSPWFDAKWYLAHNPDVAQDRKMAKNPARHYLLLGGFEGRNPSPAFDSAYYLERNPDVAETGMNPLVHYLKFGEKEQRSIKRL
ncbi:hypothetical protein [Vreelandella venusta]|uniref:Uncharacterized protein n=1 Tax=Vreelandella venusta TaxID=44935 RepID=A0AAP9ZJC5_9GAMM|nr:hypothetical protein [Halomonas venusta]QRL02082.1 hypothetical protein JDS37_12230 [Halomonas venusta]GEK53084.1 hypothetical protein HVE01_38050 [Halomonas venusta]